jgi:hypothetical protein
MYLDQSRRRRPRIPATVRRCSAALLLIDLLFDGVLSTIVERGIRHKTRRTLALIHTRILSEDNVLYRAAGRPISTDVDDAPTPIWRWFLPNCLSCHEISCFNKYFVVVLQSRDVKKKSSSTLFTFGLLIM